MINKLSPIDLCKKLFPINRSLTGKGNRETLSILKSVCPKLVMKSFKCKKKVFDWKIPKEWVVKDAYLLTPDKKKICSFKENNLHLVGYSRSVNKNINLKELQKNLHSLPDQPNAIPYITSYYEKNWGFCISDKQRKKLKKGIYKVVVDTKFIDGKLDYAEIIHKGNLKKEVFFSTYICHPSMANDEISGMVVAIFLANYLRKKNTRYSYRFLFIPETIGSIAYLSKNLNNLKNNMLAGYVLSCVGDERCFSFFINLPFSILLSSHLFILSSIFSRIAPAV